MDWAINVPCSRKRRWRWNDGTDDPDRGQNEFGDICRREVRIDKSEERLRDGDLELSTVMVGRSCPLQDAVVTREAETYALDVSARIATPFG